MNAVLAKEGKDYFTCSKKEAFAKKPKLLQLLATKLCAPLPGEKYQVLRKAKRLVTNSDRNFLTSALIMYFGLDTWIALVASLRVRLERKQVSSYWVRTPLQDHL